MYRHLKLELVIVTLGTWGWDLSKRSYFFWLFKYWVNLILILTYTKPMVKQSLQIYFLTHCRKWGYGWKWTIWYCHVNDSVWMYFIIFIPKSTLFYWVVNWVWLDRPWFFMGVEFYKEINLGSIKSIYVILVYWGVM